MEQLGSHRTDFHEIWYLSIFGNLWGKMQVSLKSDENNGTLREEQYTFLIIFRSVLFRIRNVSDKIVEKIKTNFVFNIFFPQKSCRL
jgi:hypothetical protein